MKYKKEIEAWQYTGNNGMFFERLSENIKQSPVLEPTDDNPTGEYLQIKYPDGSCTVKVGDYVIKVEENECYFNIDEKIFKEEYEEIRNDELMKGTTLTIGLDVIEDKPLVKKYTKSYDVKYNIGQEVYVIIPKKIIKTKIKSINIEEYDEIINITYKLFISDENDGVYLQSYNQEDIYLNIEELIQNNK